MAKEDSVWKTQEVLEWHADKTSAQHRDDVDRLRRNCWWPVNVEKLSHSVLTEHVERLGPT